MTIVTDPRDAEITALKARLDRIAEIAQEKRESQHHSLRNTMLALRVIELIAKGDK